MLPVSNHKAHPHIALVPKGRGIAEEVREGESRFRILADLAPVVVWTTDEQGRCTYISRFWEELTGRNPQSDLGHEWNAALHPEDRSRAVSELMEAVRAKQPSESEYRVRRASGEYVWVSGRGVPYFRPDGSYAGHIVTSVDITAHKNREAERALINHSLLLGQEAERKRIARELHDDIGQKLALLGVTLSEIEQLLKTNPVAMKEKLREVRQTVDTIASETHLMSHNLHPSMLAHLGLVPALRRLCKDFSARKHVRVEFNGEDLSEEPAQEIATALFRIAEECLANVAKHSGAQDATVDLFQQDRKLQLVIKDSGCGFDPNQSEAQFGLGLISMRERARMIGGEIKVDSAPWQGARISVSVPFQRRKRGSIAV
jgi:PAS domain S-box-containing protein